MNDVRDILEMRGEDPTLATPVSKKSKKQAETFKRPEGMHRELYALLCADGGKNLELAPLLPTDTPGGYKRKADLGAKRVRQWKWTPFTNPGRKDGAIFYHWKRVVDENKEYPFAKFNREVPVLKYSESEYSNHLEREGWTKEETDHVFDLARSFDLRFPVMQDRYNRVKFPNRSIEDIKDRYYQVNGILTKLRAEPGAQDPKPYAYDADHERKRKEQLNKLWSRSQEQVEEEEFLRSELKKIEARKKEREKKTQDLQKLITAADGGGPPPAEQAKKSAENVKKSGANLSKKKSTSKSLSLPTPDTLLIKWADAKNPGATTRSARVKLPGSVGQRRAKVVESTLAELGVDPHPFLDEEVGQKFCELRSNIVLNYELNSLLGACNLELQSLKHQYELIKPGETLEIPPSLHESFSEVKTGSEPGSSSSSSNVLDSSGILPQKKRKAAIEQGNILKKLKNKM